jgi:hypothetical protein
VFLQDGTPACVGKYRNGEKFGVWRTYGARGKPSKTTKHKSN